MIGMYLSVYYLLVVLFWCKFIKGLFIIHFVSGDGSHLTDLNEFWYLSFLENLSRKYKFSSIFSSVAGNLVQYYVHLVYICNIYLKLC
jgi:hypothetical protein